MRWLPDGWRLRPQGRPQAGNGSTRRKVVSGRALRQLLVIKKMDANGNTVERERHTTVNHAMKTCRRARNVVARRNAGKLPPR
jgi:hypothetical protein